MRNSYRNINFDTAHKIISANHWHATIKDHFLAIVDTGLEHFALSNYVPAHITYPLNNNRLIKLTDEDIPEGILQSPNTENVMFSNILMHVSTMGSLHNTPGALWDKEVDGEYLTYQEMFDIIFSKLEYVDGGGIVINHPVRSHITQDEAVELLEYDDRVLGIEAYNHRSHRDYGKRGVWMDGWDNINKLGKRCYGFFSPDEHTPPSAETGFVLGEDMRDYNAGLGRNVLLSNERTARGALKAYRNGEFYGALFGDRIVFENIDVAEDKFVVQTDVAERIDLFSYSLIDGAYIKNDVVTVLSSYAEFDILPEYIFVRAVAYEDKNDTGYEMPIVNEKIYTQPIYLKTEEEVAVAVAERDRIIERSKKKKMVVLL